MIEKINPFLCKYELLVQVILLVFFYAIIYLLRGELTFKIIVLFFMVIPLAIGIFNKRFLIRKGLVKKDAAVSRMMMSVLSSSVLAAVVYYITHIHWR